MDRKWVCWGIGILMAITLSVSGCKSAAILGGSVDPARLIDGVYKGFSKGGPNSAEVEVTVKDRRIVQVIILKHDAWKGKKADPIIPQLIVEKQSTNVDAVSGATNSSNVIMNAVQDAVEKSYGSKGSENP